MTPNVYAALKQLHRDGSLPLAEDPSLSIAMLWERFQVLGKSTSPPSFSGNGAESFQNAMAEAWVNLPRLLWVDIVCIIQHDMNERD